MPKLLTLVKIRIEGINCSDLIDYLNYLNQKQFAPATKSKCISALVSLFETGVANKWFSLESYLIRHQFRKKISQADYDFS